jgi:hypothetical protein
MDEMPARLAKIPVDLDLETNFLQNIHFSRPMYVNIYGSQ